jgi:hypothetical protein
MLDVFGLVVRWWVVRVARCIGWVVPEAVLSAFVPMPGPATPAPTAAPALEDDIGFAVVEVIGRGAEVAAPGGRLLVGCGAPADMFGAGGDVVVEVVWAKAGAATASPKAAADVSSKLRMSISCSVEIRRSASAPFPGERGRFGVGCGPVVPTSP